MPSEWRDPPGQTSIDSHALEIAKAKEFYAAIRVHPYANSLECRRGDAQEIIVFEVEVEVPQRPVFEIRKTERLAAIFTPDNANYPEVVSLRPDFPPIPHLNLRPIGASPSLCLYEQPYPEIKLKWTGFRFLERIRDFLASSAKGDLHAPDQPLEPLVSPSTDVLAISGDFLFAANQTVDFFSILLQDDGVQKTLVASRKPGLARNSIAILLEGSTIQTHGVISAAPSNLRQLQDYAASAGIDVIGAMQEALRKYKLENPFPATNGAYVLLLLRLPKSRQAGAAKETEDLYGFMCFEQLGALGEKLGLWTFHNGNIGMLLAQTALQADQVALWILRPQLAMSAAVGATLSGTIAKPFHGAFVGVGALGSNLLSHLVRTGFGNWKIVDKDVLMAHNFARHAAHWGVGIAKVRVIAEQFNAMFDENLPLTPLQGDVLDNNALPDLLTALETAEFLVDCAATVPISRFLAIDISSTARRMAAFLNPRGTDVVFLAEDDVRTIRLDHLEMQYYATLVRHPELRNHLQHDDGMRRYSNACRDTSAVIPEEYIAITAAIASKAIRNAYENKDASVCIWSIEPRTLEVRSYSASPSHFRSFQINGWTVFADEVLIAQVGECRRAKLPRETGGVLIGSFDTQRRIAYVVEQIASPKDSRERPSSYIRGCEGLEERTKEISKITQYGLEYVGDWHSHPDGCNAERSPTDRRAIQKLSEFMFPEGLPVIMLIVAHNQDTRVYVETAESLTS